MVWDLELLDPADFAEYQRAFPAILERHGGTYVVRGGPVTVFSGEWDLHRLIMLEFPDRAALDATFADPDYLPLIPIRERSTRSRSFIVDGWDGSAPH